MARAWIYFLSTSLVLMFILATVDAVTDLEFNTSRGEGQCTCEFKSNTDTLNVKCDPSIDHHEVRECFKKHKKTKQLYFKDSALTSIPSDIDLLDDLVLLDLSRNNLQSLDLKPMKHVCKTLVILILDNNNIQKLQKASLNCLKSLETFSIANNSLSLIENGTFTHQLKRLKNIQIKYNRLTSIDSSFFYLPNLITGDDHVILINATWNSIDHATNSINLSISDIKRNYSIGIVLTHNLFTGINYHYYLKMFNVKNIEDLYKLWNSGFDLRFNRFICDCSMERVAEMFKMFKPMDPDNPLFSVACWSPSSLSGTMLYKVDLNQFNCSRPDACPKGCSCTETIHINLMTVYCGAGYMSSTLPVRVPNLDDIHINIKSGLLTRLSYRYYMINTTILDVSGCALNSISTNVLTQLAKTDIVYLHDNNLLKLPRDIEAVRFDGLRVMTLRGNQFSCDCHSMWFKQWLIRNQQYIVDVDRVLCADGPGKDQPIIHTKDGDFVCVYPITTKEILIIVFSIVFLLVVIFVLIHYHRTTIQIMMIAYCNVYVFRKKGRGDYLYDVFISHSSKDDDWVISTLMKGLECQKPPYKVFFDERNFELGRTIVHNVDRAIRCSRTTLLVLTNNFLRSTWCMMEFKQAHLRLLKDRDINFIVIIKGELDSSLMGEELKSYLHTNVYIKHADKYFWPKLLHALPIAPQGPPDNTHNTTCSDRSPLLVNS